MANELYQIPELPQEIDAAYRKAHRALEALWPQDSSFVAEAELQNIHDVVAQFALLADRAEMAVAAHLGPEISWEVDQGHPEFELTVAGVDLNDGRYSFGARPRISSGKERSDE